MTHEFQIRVLPQQAASEQTIKDYIARDRGIDIRTIYGVRVLRRSIDARQRTVYVNLTVRVYVNEMPQDDVYRHTEYRDVSGRPQVIVVGEGPGGLFASLRLIELGLRPVVIERGKNVRERKTDLSLITRTHKVDGESNYCFGEGGAGAYSDGKLYTRSKKRGNTEKILNVFCQHGASPSILADAHPHIGTDKLPRVIENMRNTILGCGGEVHFSTKMTGLLVSGDTVDGIEAVDLTTGRELTFRGPVILATGHSARDVYRYLDRTGIEMEPKGLAVGVRLEHPAALIDRIQYHNKNGRGKYLPAAEYSFVTQVDGRGVYSFCMCPGGVVVAAASEENRLVSNGMSYHARDKANSNSALVVTVGPEDFEGTSVLRGMEFQRHYESLAYKVGGGGYKAPVQLLGDFVNGRKSTKLGAVIPSYEPGFEFADMRECLPSYVVDGIKEGVNNFDRKIKGYGREDAVLTGIETRTSAPVKITRNERLESISLSGLYPCGEGAGFAGGIVSAAVDGIKVAERIIEKYSAIQ